MSSAALRKEKASSKHGAKTVDTVCLPTTVRKVALTLKKAKSAALNLAAVIALPVFLLILTKLYSPDRVNWGNVWDLLMQAFNLSILAYGLVFQISAGTMDLSLGAVYILAAVFGGNFAIRLGWGLPGMAVVCILTGLILGATSGAFFAIFKIPSFIISIAMMMIFESLSITIYGGGGVSVPTDLVVLNAMPWNILIPVIAGAVSFFLYTMTPLGAHAKAVGHNPRVAEVNGIRTLRVKLICFAVMGAFAGLYSFVQLGRIGFISGVQNMGSLSISFDALMCTFLAVAVGIKINRVICVYFCAFILQTMKFTLSIFKLPSIFQTIAVGIFVLILLGIMNNRSRFTDWVDRRRIRSCRPDNAI